jgi:hypothetical protein
MQSLFLVLTIVYAALAVYFAIKNDHKTICFFMLSVLFQNIIAIIFHSRVPELYITVFSLIKEIMLYIAVIVALIRNWKDVLLRSFTIPLIIYAVIVLINLFTTPEGLYAAVVSLRYLALPVLCITIGTTLKIDREKFDWLMKFLVFYAAVLALTGLIERFILGDDFWRAIGYTQYAIDLKGNTEWSIINGVTINFYTWDFLEPVRRIVGITADPLATAYLLFIGAAIVVTGCIKEKTNKQLIKFWFCAGLAGISSILVFSKAIFVLIPIMLLIMCYFNEWISKKIFIITASVGGVIIAIGLALYLLSADSITATLVHIKGLINGLLSMSALGNGLGTAGVGAAMLAGAEVSAAESFIGSMAAQIGFLGLCAFLIYIYMVFRKLLTLWRFYHDKITLLAIVLLCGLMICMLFSESSVSIMGTGIYFILIGIANKDDIYSS